VTRRRLAPGSSLFDGHNVSVHDPTNVVPRGYAPSIYERDSVHPAGQETELPLYVKSCSMERCLSDSVYVAEIDSG
jgi:hypothetical protein